MPVIFIRENGSEGGILTPPEENENEKGMFDTT